MDGLIPLALLTPSDVFMRIFPQVFSRPSRGPGRKTLASYERRNRGKDYRGAPGYGRQEAARRLARMQATAA